MKGSDTRIDYIASYISAYEAKIKLLNKEGLFDSAKMFELFASEVGSLLLGQKLFNLNVETFSYPAVDLISENKSIYVQVSTTGNIPNKIKSTLEKVRDSSDETIKNITKIKFIVLNNESIDKVVSYEGNNAIGNVSFNKDEDLITTQTILKKAEFDLDFQQKLYELLLQEESSIQDNLSKLKDAFENSKIYLNNIDSKINGEYVINRQSLVDKINQDNYKNISIQGQAGSGKSVLCKKIIEGKERVLFARAERFLEEKNINDIWGFNVRESFQVIGDQGIIIFIDSLEAIADNHEKLDLLSILYDCAKEYPSIRIITSCRTSDKAAFLKLEGNYSIHTYDMPDLNQNELNDIAKHYPIICEMQGIDAYKEFIVSPFYINIIVGEIKDINCVIDETQFRNYIWEKVICKRGHTYKEIIQKIVFDRAKTLSVGVIWDSYDEAIISLLISDGILIKNKDTIRLKYDIFEDICFEQYFDKVFFECQGDYKNFFETIEQLGPCAFRRYQIWLENKLLAKHNREKYLYDLNFSDKVPSRWKTQTIIGLVKSRHSEFFFEDYERQIINLGLLLDYIKYTNLYAYEINCEQLNRYSIQLRPTGSGRKSLIHIIAKNKTYEGNKKDLFLIAKICSDYANTKSIDQQTAKECVKILGEMINSLLHNESNEDYYTINDDINRLIAPIYKMANYDIPFIEEFWEIMKTWSCSDKHNKISLSKSVIEYTLKFEHSNLAKFMPKQLCNLAEFFWTHKQTESKSFYYQLEDRNNLLYQYGLNENAENYEYGNHQTSPLLKSFFLMLFSNHFWDGLDWSIQFINKCITSFKTNKKGGLYEHPIFFIETAQKKLYWGCENLWLATAQEHSLPLLISDLIYCLKYEINLLLKNATKGEKLNNFANKIKKEIFEKSNNIALLTIISDIGMKYEKLLPGYSLDILTNIDLILYDLHRSVLCIDNPARAQLEKHLLLTMGVPFELHKRYKDLNIKSDLERYFLLTYLYNLDPIRHKCCLVLDYLYSKIPNDKEHAIAYLQIQKMDIRKANTSVEENGLITIEPAVTGAAKEVSERIGISDLDSEIHALCSECLKSLTEQTISTKLIVESIRSLLPMIERSTLSLVHEKNLITIISQFLLLDNLDVADRCNLCDIWVSGINTIVERGTFNFDIKSINILFSQLNKNIDKNTKDKIKKVILDCILYDGPNGVIHTLSDIAHSFLYANNDLSIVYFNTIIKLAEDKMQYEKYNAQQLKRIPSFKSKENAFIPNRQPSLKGVDHYLQNNEKYQSQKQIIIEQYLFNEIAIDLSGFKIQNYDINLVAYALNCRASISDSNLSTVVEKCINEMIEIFNLKGWIDILGTSATNKIKSLFQRDFIEGSAKTEKVLSILFDKIDPSKLSNDSIRFYIDIFSCLFMDYFDAYNSLEREKCEKIIRMLEEKILNLSNEFGWIELYKSLTLSLPKYVGLCDLSECKSGYSYHDKIFLNEYFGKYGGYHLEELLSTLYAMNVEKLLPEIIVSLNIALKKHIELTQALPNKNNEIILFIATRIFLDYEKEVKDKYELKESFEGILQTLREFGYAEAAVMLDEFRIH